MASAKDLRKRISSVKNTQQITKAMKMVSAAKLRRAQSNILALRPYAHEVNSVIAGLAKASGAELSHPLLNPKSDDEIQTALVVIVTSDRGLCGGFNGNVMKAAQRFLRTHGHKYKKLDFAFIGKKGYEFFRSRKTGKYYQDFAVGLNFAKANGLAQELINLYLSGEYDEIKFIYNEFKSAISQKVNVETLLPIRSMGDGAASAELALTIYEPGPQQILEQLLPQHFAVQVFRMVLESLAGEHGARMAAMENATKNAGEMIRKITLLYNKTRQAGITKELLEIISGTEAAKG
ncbi:MAG: ATP synthase F1 subunit gamma [Deltaproteobacteria bacterium]|nr:ATP synthase F1 subunit gamma [Deltaproteobacteria bacterium]